VEIIWTKRQRGEFGEQYKMNQVENANKELWTTVGQFAFSLIHTEALARCQSKRLKLENGNNITWLIDG
jgi:hypothetical protein